MKVRKTFKGSLRQQGFTLVEVVVSMTILGAILLSVSMLTKPVTDLWVIQSFRDGAQNETRLALLRIIREVSQVKDSKSVYIAQGSQIKFTTTQNVSVTFSLSGTNLMRNSQVLAANIDQFQLSYWGNTHQTIAAPAVNPQDTDIYRVGVLMHANANGRAATLRSQIRPRNLYG